MYESGNSKRKRFANSFILSPAWDGFTSYSSPLVRAVRKGNLKGVKERIELEDDVNGFDHQGMLALVRAAYGGFEDIAKVLLDAGADINKREYAGLGWTPLVGAAIAGNGTMISMLLDKGASTSIRDVTGNTALMHAKKQGNTQIAMELSLKGRPDDDNRKIDYRFFIQSSIYRGVRSWKNRDS